MKTKNEMKLEMDSRSVNEAFARSAVGAFASQLDPTLEEINDIKTAVSEAVTNCIIHAYPDTVGKIWISARIVDGGYLDLVIKDKGKGIENIEKAMEPMFTTGGSERSGMGFTIMESFMSTLRVKSSPTKGTTVRMAKRIHTKLPGGK